MTIRPNQDFKHERKSYKKGRKYEVDDELVEYFKECGWVGERIAGANVSLDVQDGVLGQATEFSN